MGFQVREGNWVLFFFFFKLNQGEIPQWSAIRVMQELHRIKKLLVNSTCINNSNSE